MKLKYISVPFILSLIAIIALRVYQFSSIGNAKVRLEWTNLELICVMITVAFLAFAIIISILSRNIPNFLKVDKHTFTGIIGALAGVLISCNGVADIIRFITSSKKDLLVLFLGIFGIAAGIIFIGLSFCSIKGGNIFETNKLLLLLPTVWGLLRLLQMFFVYNAIATNIIDMSDEFAVIFLLLFMFYQSKLFAGIINKFAFRAVFMFGFTATLFIIIYSSLELLRCIDMGESLGIYRIIALTADLALGLYIALFLFSINANSKAKGMIEYAKELEDKKEDNVAKAEKENKEESSIDMKQVDHLVKEIEQESISKVDPEV